jgi:hypothetical protein
MLLLVFLRAHAGSGLSACISATTPCIHAYKRANHGGEFHDADRINESQQCISSRTCDNEESHHLGRY